MEINTKEKQKFTYLKKVTDSNISIYFEEESGKFYSFQNKNNSVNWGFSAMFLSPLLLPLKKIIVNNIFLYYWLACLLGIILLHRSYSSKQLKEIELSSEEIRLCLENLKKIKQVKIILAAVWFFFFIMTTVTYFDEKNYRAILGVCLTVSLLVPLLENLKFIKDNKLKKRISLKIKKE